MNAVHIVIFNNLCNTFHHKVLHFAESRVVINTAVCFNNKIFVVSRIVLCYIVRHFAAETYTVRVNPCFYTQIAAVSDFYHLFQRVIHHWCPLNSCDQMA